MDLLPLFRGLSRPSLEEGKNTFHVAPIPGFASHRLGRDGNGAPVVLLHVEDRRTQAPGPVVLQHIVAQHDVRCRLVSSTVGSSREETVSLLRCVSAEPALREYFVRVVELAVQQLGNRPSRADVSRVIKRLTELFRAFEQPARKSIQGLWAEVFVIVVSENPEALIAAWHVDPDEAFDFSSGPQRIEVKSFAGEARVHSFSLRQARPGAGVDALIASVRAERSSGGSSVADLIRLIVESGVSNDAIEKVETVVARSLGEAAATGLWVLFDAERARSSLRFFDARDVPSVDSRLPAGVLSVRFESLLEDACGLAADEQGVRGGLFAAALPRS